MNASQKSRKRGTTITLPPRLIKIEANCKKRIFAFPRESLETTPNWLIFIIFHDKVMILHETLPFFALKRLSRCTFAKSCDFGLILGLETLYTSEISESVSEKTKTRNHCYFPSQIYEIPWKSLQKSSKSVRGVAKIENRIFPENIPKIIGIPLVKQGFANERKRMRKALEGLQKMSIFCEKSPKRLQKALHCVQKSHRESLFRNTL